MEKEFVTVGLALRLKALRFDWKCFAASPKTSEVFEIVDPEDWNEKIHGDLLVKRPTFSQAFRWLRDEYDLWGCIQKYPTSENPKRCYYELRGDNINTDNDESPNSYMSGWFDSYDDAELACLTKMLDIEEAR